MIYFFVNASLQNAMIVCVCLGTQMFFTENKDRG